MSKWCRVAVVLAAVGLSVILMSLQPADAQPKIRAKTSSTMEQIVNQLIAENIEQFTKTVTDKLENEIRSVKALQASNRRKNSDEMGQLEGKLSSEIADNAREIKNIKDAIDTKCCEALAETMKKEIDKLKKDVTNKLEALKREVEKIKEQVENGKIASSKPPPDPKQARVIALVSKCSSHISSAFGLIELVH